MENEDQPNYFVCSPACTVGLSLGLIAFGLIVTITGFGDFSTDSKLIVFGPICLVLGLLTLCRIVSKKCPWKHQLQPPACHTAPGATHLPCRPTSLQECQYRPENTDPEYPSHWTPQCQDDITMGIPVSEQTFCMSSQPSRTNPRTNNFSSAQVLNIHTTLHNCEVDRTC